jgi:hypothetical protein
MNCIEQVADRSDTELAALADECRRDAGSDIAHAVDLMIERVRHSEPLYHRLHDPLTRTACFDWLRRSYDGAQQSGGPLPLQSPADQDARARARAEATRLAMEALRPRR